MFRVGTSKLTINPPMYPLPTSRGGSIEDICDGEDLHVRCIAVDNGVKIIYICCAELSGPADPYIIEERARNELGIPRENIILTGTHSHAVPPTDVRSMKDHLKFLAGPNNLQFVNTTDHAAAYGLEKPTNEATEAFKHYVIDRTIEALRLSTENMKPAKVGYGSGKSYININRYVQCEDGRWYEGPNPEGFSDRELSVLRFNDLEGGLIAAVLNYGCHANTTYISKEIDGVRKATCEFVGVACNYIEQRFGNDAVVLWTSGAAGDQNPVFNFLVPDYAPDGSWKLAQAVPGSTYQAMRSLGKTHAIDAIKIMKSIDSYEEDITINCADSTDLLRTRAVPAGMDRKEFADKTLHAQRTGTAPPEAEVGEPAEIYNQLITINDIALLGFACEAYAKIGYDVKQASPFAKTMYIAHCGAPMPGYIPSEDCKDHVGLQFGGGVDPTGISERFVEIMKDRFRDCGFSSQH